MCSPTNPCGGILCEADDNYDMVRNGLPQRAVRCLNGHSFWLSRPDLPNGTLGPTLEWCDKHERFGPCRACAAQGAERPSRPCLICESPIPGDRWKYCSEACKTEADRRADRKVPRAKDPCQQCGKPIPVGRTNYRYCGPTCYVGAERERSRLRRLERKRQRQAELVPA